jgi:hypothetical protein
MTETAPPLLLRLHVRRHAADALGVLPLASVVGKCLIARLAHLVIGRPFRLLGSRHVTRHSKPGAISRQRTSRIAQRRRSKVRSATGRVRSSVRYRGITAAS